LNEMVTDALRHIPDCLEYLQMVRDPNVFKFCAIPQAMAIATLSVLYNNHEVFERDVKIRKGEALSIIMYCTDYDKVSSIFKKYVLSLEARMQPDDPSVQAARSHVQKAKEILGLC